MTDGCYFLTKFRALTSLASLFVAKSSAKNNNWQQKLLLLSSFASCPILSLCPFCVLSPSCAKNLFNGFCLKIRPHSIFSSLSFFSGDEWSCETWTHVLLLSFSFQGSENGVGDLFNARKCEYLFSSFFPISLSCSSFSSHLMMTTTMMKPVFKRVHQSLRLLPQVKKSACIFSFCIAVSFSSSSVFGP